ncbi:MAG: flavin monoamine oxidase family protein [Burkholderiaceae bacterium]
MTTSADVLVVGAGLSGLAATFLLAEMGRKVLVLEARDEPGGRIASVRDGGDWAGDLGPTWIWPDFQPSIKHWIPRLDLQLDEQFSQGLTLVERGGEQPIQRVNIPEQAGSQRIVGGPQALIDALCDRLVPGTLQAGAGVTEVHVQSEQGEVRCVDSRGKAYTAEQVIIATPLRIAARDIQFEPSLPDELTRKLSAAPTWMARHAKVVIRYESAFWRAQGLTGRLLSAVGPLAEVHDHCGPGGEPPALFGFAAWPPSQRQNHASEWDEAIEAQLVRCYGPQAANPVSITTKDWALDQWTTTESDLEGPAAHPDVLPEMLRRGHWHQRLWFASAETAQRDPGLIAGALASAERVAKAVLNAR